MKVKIANQYYDSKDEPIMIILDESDLIAISSMIGNKYCSYPDEKQYTENDFAKIKAYMKDI